MELVNREAIVYLTSEGFAQLGSVVGVADEFDGIVVYVAEADGFGPWLSIAGRPSPRLLIVPWHFIRAFEIGPDPGTIDEEKRIIGFRS